ncbi:unnamed protein product [Oikopleura dioica]|uniref:Cytochrome c oxidase subunit 5A, mitochondrial n=1 Tax=Oikopleura dioica TaxID=34765 RepID=E4XH86_OIKDI|nr:unnamed protein product [Oikopleura dioica]
MSLFRALRPVTTATVRRSLTVSAQLNSAAPAAPLRRDDVMAAWVEYFDHPDCDYYNYRLGAQHLFSDDLLFDPVVYQAMLYSCRRFNNFPAAMRTLELIRLKCGDREDVYDWVMQELAPTLEDLGIPTVEDMNLHIVETEL